MESFVWIGFAAFFVASLSVGVRLIRLWWRTRELPELLIGTGVLGIGPVGFGLSTIAELARPGSPQLARWLFGVALLAIASGAFAKYVFNWRVYHPDSAALRRFVWTAGALLAACYVSEFFTTGFQRPYQQNLAYFTRSGLQVGCLLWGSAEALVYWRKMRRRLQLGIADPVVTNRFFLWGLGAGAAGVGSAVGIVAQIVTGLPPLEISWVTLSSSLHGLTAAVAMWLAFLPTPAYLRFVESRARRIGAV
jgi:hypothetical protein